MADGGNISSARSRRIRSAKTKQRLWLQNLYASAWVSAVPTAAAVPLWQPDAEQPPFEFRRKEADKHLHIEWGSSLNANTPSSHLDLGHENREFYGAVSKISSDLQDLHDTLCTRLYSQNQTRLHPVDLSTELENVEPVIAAAVKRIFSDTESVAAEYDDVEVFMTSLASIQECIRVSLPLHQEASCMAQEIESRNISQFDVDELDDSSLQHFLLQIYKFQVPEGIAKRRAEDEMYEHMLEEEERDISLARLGHTFTYNRQHFWSQVANVPPGLKRELVSFVVNHPLCIGAGTTTSVEFQELFFRDPRMAYAWQELYNDDHGADDLVTLLKLLRRYIDT